MHAKAIISAVLLSGLLFVTSQAQTPPNPVDLRSTPTFPTRTTIPDPLRDNSKAAVFPTEHSLEGQIVRVSNLDRKLVIEDVKSKKLINIQLDPDTKLKADKQTELAGKDKLSVSDFKPGHRVKITYISLGPKVLTVRLLRQKK